MHYCVENWYAEILDRWGHISRNCRMPLRDMLIMTLLLMSDFELYAHWRIYGPNQGQRPPSPTRPAASEVHGMRVSWHDNFCSWKKKLV